MSRILVTGGMGNAGPWVIDHLLSHDYDVGCVDRQSGELNEQPVSFYEADITQHGAVWDIVCDYDPDGIIHLATITPNSGGHHETEMFTANTRMTYHVLRVAGQAGIPIAWTSSETVYGQMYENGQWYVDRLPVDETTSTRPTGAYPTSKLAGEVIAGAIAREFDIPVASVRPSWVVRPRHSAETSGTTYEGSLANRQEEFEFGAGTLPWNLWSYIDVRDLAGMLRAALEREPKGHEIYLAAADENYIDEPTAEAAESIAGDLPPECSLEGDQSAQSNAKAKRDLDWEPRHSWKTATNADISPPAMLQAQ